MTRSYADKDIKLLFALSGGYCAFPECRVLLIAQATGNDAAVVLAQICHMVASSDDGPRGDKEFPEVLRNQYDNLLLLCGYHHTLVDRQPNTYSIADLQGWKSELEDYVAYKLAEGMRSIDFAELEIICKHMVSAYSGVGSSPMVPADVQEKMDTNRLTDRIAYRMKMGLMQAPQVASFLANYSSMFDPDFPHRLREGFLHLYNQHKSAGLDGDALFIALERDAATVAPLDSSRRWEYEAASLAVLCHLFELCDVFESPR